MIRPLDGQPPGGLSAVRGLATPQGIFGVYTYYKLLILFFNIVPLISESTFGLLVHDPEAVARNVEDRPNRLGGGELDHERLGEGELDHERLGVGMKTIGPSPPGGRRTS
jgi:hypothetical protein